MMLCGRLGLGGVSESGSWDGQHWGVWDEILTPVLVVRFVACCSEGGVSGGLCAGMGNCLKLEQDNVLVSLAGFYQSEASQ